MTPKACVVLLLGLCACGGGVTVGTVAPDSSVTNAADPSQRGKVMQYAHALRFDTLTHGAWDQQPLTLVDSSVTPHRDTIGPVGTIYPERRTHHNSEADLQGVGRIVARIYTTGEYPRLGLRAGVSYYWVDSLVVTGDSGVARAIFIPEDSTQPVTVRQLVYARDPHGAALERQAMARWRYYPLHSALPWNRCTRMGCCEAQ